MHAVFKKKTNQPGASIYKLLSSECIHLHWIGYMQALVMRTTEEPANISHLWHLHRCSATMDGSYQLDPPVQRN